MATEPASTRARVPKAIAREIEYTDGDRKGRVAEAKNPTRTEGSQSGDQIPDRKVFVCIGAKAKH